MKKLSFLLLLIIGMITQCDYTLMNEEAQSYEDAKDTFHDSLFTHIPNPLDNKASPERRMRVKALGLIKGEYSDTYINNHFKLFAKHSRYIYAQEVSDRIYKEEKQKFESHARRKYKNIDSNLVYIFDMELINGIYYMLSLFYTDSYYYSDSIDELGKHAKYINIDYTLDKKLPVPFIKKELVINREDKVSDTVFQKNLTHYVIDARKGIFNKNIPARDTCMNYPDSWCNGYSRGASFFDEKNQIFYWIFMW